MNTIFNLYIRKENLEFRKPPGKILEFIDFWWKIRFLESPWKNLIKLEIFKPLEKILYLKQRFD